jgi:hypothetical protein
MAAYSRTNCTAPRSPDLKPSDFHLWGQFKKSHSIQLPLKMKRHFTNTLYYVYQTIFNYPVLLKGRDSPWSDVFMRALIYVEDILIIFMNRELKNNTESTVIKLRTFILNVLGQL